MASPHFVRHETRNHPAELLRACEHAAALLEASRQDDVALTVAAVLRDFASTGGALDMARALGFRERGGITPKRAAELGERDTIILRLFREHFVAHGSRTASAQAIADGWARYAAMFDHRAEAPAPDTPQALFHRLCRRNEDPLRYRRILQILDMHSDPRLDCTPGE